MYGCCELAVRCCNNSLEWRQREGRFHVTVPSFGYARKAQVRAWGQKPDMSQAEFAKFCTEYRIRWIPFNYFYGGIMGPLNGSTQQVLGHFRKSIVWSIYSEYEYNIHKGNRKYKKSNKGYRWTTWVEFHECLFKKKERDVHTVHNYYYRSKRSFTSNIFFIQFELNLWME